MNNDIYIDYSNIMKESIGNDHGISVDELDNYQDIYLNAHRKLQIQRKGEVKFYHLPYSGNDIQAITDLGRKISNNFENVVVLGIGGSALGPFSIFKALMHPYYNDLSSEKRNGPKFYVMDNVDPDYFAYLEDAIDFKKTAFLVITKSGSTAETISGFMYVLGVLGKKSDVDIKKQFFFVTDPEKGPLRSLAADWGIDSLSIPPGVGGRFSVLTPVGLLPSAILGIDCQSLLDGAAMMDQVSFKTDILESPAYIYAIIHWLYYKKNKPIHVMFPYSNSLDSMADWFRQLWAESLGKKIDLDNNIIHVGPTPVKALGTTDQHSQVQLYVEGPNDKVFTFLEVEQFRKSGKIEGELPFRDFRYLHNKSLEQLILAEKKATEIALSENQRPNLTLKIPSVTPYTIGQLFYLFELATAFSGCLMNINPYDQPGVEHGKIATYALMGREGYQDKKNEIETKARNVKKYILKIS